MFIRWKGRYAYLEQRYLDYGKVKCRSQYLGQNPFNALAKMFSTGEIDRRTYERIVKWKPEGILQPTGRRAKHQRRNVWILEGGENRSVFWESLALWPG